MSPSGSCLWQHLPARLGGRYTSPVYPDTAIALSQKVSQLARWYGTCQGQMTDHVLVTKVQQVLHMVEAQGVLTSGCHQALMQKHILQEEGILHNVPGFWVQGLSLEYPSLTWRMKKM